MFFRKLTNNDWYAHKEMRLEAVKNNSHVLATRYEDELLKTEEYWQMVLNNPKRIVYGCFIGKQLVAIASLAWMNWSSNYPDNINPNKLALINTDMQYLIGVYNKPAFRGTGLMHQFLTYILVQDDAKAPISLIVAKHNLAAIKLYQKLGFEIIVTLPPRTMANGTDCEEYLMKLSSL